MVLADAQAVLAEIEETVEGHRFTHPQGTGGFGYDPIFLPDGAAGSMAELTMEAKNAISHRGKAFRRAAAVLHSRLFRR